MYQKHFGLKTKPFGSNAEGPAVFVGPQQTQVINSLKKGLNAVDSVVAVSGPVGVGKTTIVSRTLESLSPGRMVALVGRMKLAPDEVLELLLTGFGISRQATGTIQRFAAFRRLLTERAAAGAQVAIVVEDAQRVGLDALVELESLTAADSGDATGANIILMGQLELNEWLATPALARLRQRTRLRQVIEPLTAPEVLGYLRHCIRAAGGDFERMFDGGAVDMLYRCSEGIPRVINNLCESALTMAAEEDAGPLTAKFIQKVARDALGIEVFLPHIPAPPIAPEAVSPQPKPESMPAPDLAPEKTPEPAVLAEPDIESTLTQKKPEWTIDQVDGVDASNEELPQELTFEVEQTARMQAINADKIIQAEKEGKKGADTPEPAFKAAPMITVDKNTQIGVLPKLTPQAETKPSPAQGPADDDLPMLSQSMRIEAPTPAPPEALLAEARPKPKPLPGAKPTPEPTQKPQAAEEPAFKPQAEAKPVPKPKVSEAEKVEPKPKPIAPAAANAEPKLKAPAAAKAEPKLKAPAAAKAEPKLKAPAAAKAEPKPQAKPKPAEKPKAKPDSKAGEKPRMPDIDTLEAAIEAAHQDASVDEPAAAPAAQKSTPATKPAAEKPVPTTKPAAEKPVPATKPAAEKPVPATKPAAKMPAPAPQATAKKPAPAPESAGDKGPDGTAVTLTGVPALTLDDVLEEKRGKSAKVIETEEELGKAESLNDLTNTMAETLFGDESFAAIAAEVVANPPPGKTAPGKSSEDVSPVMLETEEQASPVKLDTANESASADASKPESPAKGPKNTGQTGNFEMTMSKRMDMLKALNKGTKSDKKAKPETTAKSNKSAALEKIELIEDKPAEVAPKANGSQPESIEQQMETAMTATVKAISDVDIPPGVDDDESEDAKSGGLFSRFKRS